MHFDHVHHLHHPNHINPNTYSFLDNLFALYKCMIKIQFFDGLVVTEFAVKEFL